MELNVNMTLTKGDLQAIDHIVVNRLTPLEKKVEKIDRKFDKLFNFLDREMSLMKKKIASRLGIEVSELSTSKY